MALAVMSQTAARRRAPAMLLEAGLLRLRGFFFLGIGEFDVIPYADQEAVGTATQTGTVDGLILPSIRF